MGWRRRLHRSDLWKVLRGAWIETNHEDRNTVIVAGTGRSGTTWVGDVVASLARARSIFEPFILGEGNRIILNRAEFERSGRDGTMRRNHQLYLRPDEEDSPHHDRIRAVLEGRIRYPWVDLQRRPGVFRARVVKTIRANLFLAYVARHWPRVRIIVVLRNPVNVINSQRAKNRKGWEFDWHPEEALGQEHLVTDHLGPFVDSIRSAEDEVERLAHKWCIETLVPLRQLEGSRRALFVSYDELVREGRGWEAILEHLGLRATPADRVARLTARRSMTSERSLEEIRRGAENPGGLNTAARRRVVEIAEAYGLIESMSATIPDLE